MQLRSTNVGILYPAFEVERSLPVGGDGHSFLSSSRSRPLIGSRPGRRGRFRRTQISHRRPALSRIPLGAGNRLGSQARFHSSNSLGHQPIRLTEICTDAGKSPVFCSARAVRLRPQITFTCDQGTIRSSSSQAIVGSPGVTASMTGSRRRDVRTGPRASVRRPPRRPRPARLR